MRMMEKKVHLPGSSESGFGPNSAGSAKALSDQALLKMKAISQLRRTIRSTSNRTALAYALGKDFLIALQYFPAIVMTKVQPLLNSHYQIVENYPREISQHQDSIISQNSHVHYSSSGSSEKNKPAPLASTTPLVKIVPPPISSEVPTSSAASTATLIINSITSSFNYVNYIQSSTVPTTQQAAMEVKVEKVAPLAPHIPGPRFKHDENIEIRTKYLTSVIKKQVGNTTPYNLVQHLDALFTHFHQHCETIPVAVENGLIKSLNKILKLHPDDIFVTNRTREIMAAIGLNPPVKGRGINVLSIDGGGVRGLVAIEVLRNIEKATNKRVHELFDYICGVSTGSILAFLLGAHHRTLDECEAMYKELSREVFSQNSFVGAGSLMWSHAYYHTPTWEKILKKQMGESTLVSLARDPNSPRVAAISAIVNHQRIAPYVFRTYSFPSEVNPRYTGGYQHEMWEAVRASAAAPTYFEEIRLGNYLHQDGGILVNNPCSIALSEAKTIWSGVPLQCVVSLGTGIALSSRSSPNFSSSVAEAKTLTSLSWKGKFLRVLDSATDTEAIHYTLNELLPRDVYFRFNPYVSEVVSLDEGSQDKLALIQAETREYLERNFERVEYVGKILTKPKGITKKVTDWWSY